MWQPKLEARVLQELNVRKTDRVLEVGTGSGYFTALLSHRAAQVVSVEINPALAAFGRANLERHGADNVTLEIGDAARGWAAHAPYDVIVLTGSTPLLPPSFVEQLAPGGRLFAVVGEAPAMTARLVVSQRDRRLALQRPVRDRDRAARQRRAARRGSGSDLIQQITPAELAAWLADGGREKPLLLDVREPWEWQTARIEGATHIPMREVPARVGELDNCARSGGDLPSWRAQPAGGDVSREERLCQNP